MHRRQDFEDAGEAGDFTADQMIVASIKDLATRGLRKHPTQGGGRDGEETLRLAAVIKAGGIEDEAERDLLCQNQRVEPGWNGIKENLDESVFDRDSGIGGVEGDFAEVVAAGLLGMEYREGDRVAMEVGQLGSHVVVVDEELVKGRGDFRSG